MHQSGAVCGFSCLPALSPPYGAGITDIITNVIGSVIGYVLYLLFRPLIERILARLAGWR